MVRHRGRASFWLVLIAFVIVLLYGPTETFAQNSMYWICTVSYYSKPYVSDVISPATRRKIFAESPARIHRLWISRNRDDIT